MVLVLYFRYLLARAERPEVFCRPGYDVLEQLENDFSDQFSLFEAAPGSRHVRDLDIQEHPRILRIGFPYLLLQQRDPFEAMVASKFLLKAPSQIARLLM